MVKRKPVDRRCSSANRKFPFRDSSGERVREERRKLPDRRIDGIGFEIEWPATASNQGVPLVTERAGANRGVRTGEKY
jgi:hypothetical protein